MTVPQIYTVIVLAVLGAIVCAWQIRRAVVDTRADDQAAEARAVEARQRVGLPHAAPDNQPGTNLFDLDTCRRILHATNQLEAGCARLWDAITEHRKEEGR